MRLLAKTTSVAGFVLTLYVMAIFGSHFIFSSEEITQCYSLNVIFFDKDFLRLALFLNLPPLNFLLNGLVGIEYGLPKSEILVEGKKT